MAGVRARLLGGSYSLRTHLIAFGLATLLPVAGLAALLLARSAALERAELEARLTQVANALANDIDREIERDLTVLRTLATMPSLRSGDWPAFYAEAKAAGGDDAYVILSDGSLKQILNTYAPYGAAAAPTGDRETARRVLESKAPVTSNLFLSPVSNRPMFTVSVPVVHDGEVRYILSLGRLTDDLLPILQGQRLGSEWVTTILDRNGTVLAGSGAHARLVGARPEAFALDAAVATRAIRRTSLAGEEVLRAVVRGKDSGWLVMANVPLALAEADLRRSFWQWAAIGALALLLTAALAALFARTMARPMTYAADAARALAGEEKILPLSSSLAEANTVVTALEGAAAELLERARHQRLLVKELGHRVKNVLAVVQALVARTLADDRPTPQARELLTQRLHALARAHEILMRTDWRGAPIADIVAAEIAPFSARIRGVGPELIVDGRMVQTFALVLHELATNAAKYGSLSNGDGKVAVSWAIGSGEEFKFRWQESDGPTVRPPTRKGFGSTLLDGAVTSDLGIRPRLAFEPAGFVYEIEAPLKAVGHLP